MEEVGGTCNTCQTVDNAVTEWLQSQEEIFKKNTAGQRKRPTQKEIILGTFQELESRAHCKTCQDIARAIVQVGKQLPVLAILKLITGGYQDLSIITDESTLPFGDGYILKLYPIQAPVPAFDTGRTFDQQIKTCLLRQWINCCEVSHCGLCSSPGLSSPSHQIYLVDLEQCCLVLKPARVKYIALSYVWGEVETGRTTKNNLDDLKKPGAIGPDTYDMAIPHTIRDAMRLVLLLNERYLWVDSFCIVQDDQETKKLHLNSMASIYANSFFTIIAAGGDTANHGLRGFVGSTEVRNIECDTIRFQSGQELLACKGGVRGRAWYPDHTAWVSRAWTFQEALFSRRLLIFNGLVSWFCRAAIWEEHVKRPTEEPSCAVHTVAGRSRMDFAAKMPTCPDIDYWMELVETFNHRQLTYDEDVVDAFAGTTSVFNRVFSGGILWGMPEMFFDFCILWTPRQVIRRRLYTEMASENHFPSWSWVGWQGHIVAGHQPIMTSPPQVDSQLITIHPVVQWFRTRNTISDIVPVNNIYPSLFRGYSDDGHAELSLGWNRQQYPDGTLYYTHDDLPSTKFRCPLPLVNEHGDEARDDQSPYLFFKAQRAWFYIGVELLEERISWTSCPATLVDYDGDLVGAIRLNMDRSDEEPPTGEICELIALSLGTADSDGNYDGVIDEWVLYDDLLFEDGFYKFYNVMWIEWKDGIAYRKAIGTVFKNVWESQALEEIDVKLG